MLGSRWAGASATLVRARKRPEPAGAAQARGAKASSLGCHRAWGARFRGLRQARGDVGSWEALKFRVASEERRVD